MDRAGGVRSTLCAGGLNAANSRRARRNPNRSAPSALPASKPRERDGVRYILRHESASPSLGPAFLLGDLGVLAREGVLVGAGGPLAVFA
jgi:hypothetical protein